jgi:hypothetical protein
VSTSSCGGSYEDTLGGVKVPIPGGMTKAGGKGVELSLPGFGGAQAAYQGKVDPEKVIEFYKKEMAARGWKPSFGIAVQGGDAKSRKREYNHNCHGWKNRWRHQHGDNCRRNAALSIWIARALCNHDSYENALKRRLLW